MRGVQAAAHDSTTGDVQVKFILAVIEGSLKVSNRKKKDIEVDLEAQGFDRMPKADGAGNKKAAAKDIENEDDDDEEPATATASGSYEYLLSMAIQSLTEEKVRILESNVYCFQKVLVSFFVAQVSDDVYMVCNVVVDVGA